MYHFTRIRSSTLSRKLTNFVEIINQGIVQGYAPYVVAIVMDTAPIRIIFSRHGTARGAEEWSVQTKEKPAHRRRRSSGAAYHAAPFDSPETTLYRASAANRESTTEVPGSGMSPQPPRDPLASTSKIALSTDLQ